MDIRAGLDVTGKRNFHLPVFSAVQPSDKPPYRLRCFWSFIGNIYSNIVLQLFTAWGIVKLSFGSSFNFSLQLMTCFYYIHMFSIFYHCLRLGCSWSESNCHQWYRNKSAIANPSENAYLNKWNSPHAKRDISNAHETRFPEPRILEFRNHSQKCMKTFS